MRINPLFEKAAKRQTCGKKVPCCFAGAFGDLFTSKNMSAAPTKLERSLSQSSINSQESAKELFPIEIPRRLRSHSSLSRSSATGNRTKPSHPGNTKPRARTSIVSKDPSLSSIESGSSAGPSHRPKHEQPGKIMEESSFTPTKHRKSDSEVSDSRNSISFKIDLHREQHGDEHMDPKGSIYDDDFVDDLLESSSQAVQAKVKKFLRRHDPQDDQRAAPSLKLKNILANLSRKDKDSDLESLHLDKERHDEGKHSVIGHLLDGILVHSKHDESDRHERHEKHDKKHSRLHSGLLDSIIDSTRRIASLKSVEPSIFGIHSEKPEKDVLDARTPEAVTEIDMVEFLAGTSPIAVKQKSISLKNSTQEANSSSDEDCESQPTGSPLPKILDSLSGSQEIDAIKGSSNSSGSPMLKILQGKKVSNAYHHAETSEADLSGPKSHPSKSEEKDLGREVDMLSFLSSTSPSESFEICSPISSQSPNLKATQASSPSKCDLDNHTSHGDFYGRESSEHNHDWHFPKFHFGKEPSDAGSISSIHSRNLSKRPRGISESLKFESLSRNSSDHSLFEKYGKPDTVIGKGAQATVRVV
jgi:hypothetical protein